MISVTLDDCFLLQFTCPLFPVKWNNYTNTDLPVIIYKDTGCVVVWIEST